jgi:hypothetical protein
MGLHKNYLSFILNNLIIDYFIENPQNVMTSILDSCDSFNNNYNILIFSYYNLASKIFRPLLI